MDDLLEEGIVNFKMFGFFLYFIRMGDFNFLIKFFLFDIRVRNGFIEYCRM